MFRVPLENDELHEIPTEVLPAPARIKTTPRIRLPRLIVAFAARGFGWKAERQPKRC
jgi:hypothetical protein